MSIDAEATAWVLYGTIPMYRDLGPGVADGRDVRQLERNLDALGYDPGTVDDDWTSATTSAVDGFQDDRGLTEDGTISRSEVVVSDGAARVGRHNAEVGEPARAGRAGHHADLDHPGGHRTARRRPGRRRPSRRSRARHPARRQRGRRPVTRVGTVATAGENGASPTVELRVALTRSRRGRLDGAPVSVSLETGRTKDALAVPVTALVATAPGRYAVELAGSRRLVAVTLGAFADDWVQVAGRASRPARAWWCRDEPRPARTSPRSTPAACGRSTASTSRRRRRARRRSSARPAPASRRCCTSWARSTGPSAGRVSVAGDDVDDARRPRARRRCARTAIGFVFQQFFLLDGMTRAGQRRRRACSTAASPAEQRRAAAREALERVGLGAPPRPPPGAAVRRRAPAGGDRPRGRRPAGDRASPTSPPATSTRARARRSSRCCASSTARARRSWSSPTTASSPRPCRAGSRCATAGVGRTR